MYTVGSLMVESGRSKEELKDLLWFANELRSMSKDRVRALLLTIKLFRRGHRINEKMAACLNDLSSSSDSFNVLDVVEGLLETRLNLQEEA
ncbi:MAG: hypothetical protein HPY71_03880 [Firmicutes bacterium]|nr:hypothetical protein [Bacillota bacterium]